MLSRREFFKGGWLTGYAVGLEPKKREATCDPFFYSFANCYALVAEIPTEELIETAKAQGIATDNRSKLDLVRALFSTSPSAMRRKV